MRGGRRRSSRARSQRRSAAHPGGQPGQRHVAGSRSARPITARARTGSDRYGLSPAHCLVQRGQERPPCLVGRCRGEHPGARLLAPGVLPPAAYRRTSRPRIVDRIIADRQASGAVNRARACSLPAIACCSTAHHRRSGRCGSRRPGRAARIRWATSSPGPGSSRRAVHASWARTATSGSDSAISTSLADQLAETGDSSPTRRTHQARTSASGCPSSRSNVPSSRPTQPYRPREPRAPRTPGPPGRSGAGRRRHSHRVARCSRRLRLAPIPDVGVIEQRDELVVGPGLVRSRLRGRDGLRPAAVMAKIRPLVRSQSASGSGWAVRRSCQSVT